MTKDQKRILKETIRENPHLTDKFIADGVGCSVSTVRRYRKVFTK